MENKTQSEIVQVLIILLQEKSRKCNYYTFWYNNLVIELNGKKISSMQLQEDTIIVDTYYFYTYTSIDSLNINEANIPILCSRITELKLSEPDSLEQLIQLINTSIDTVAEYALRIKNIVQLKKYECYYA